MNIKDIFKKKEEVKKQPLMFNCDSVGQTPIELKEPWTMQKQRIEEGFEDYGHKNSIKLYNAHKTKLENQWINPIQGVNGGLGSSNLSYYNYQVVDFIECSFLAQDPLMNNVFDILSTTPFQKGGLLTIVGDEENQEKVKKIEEEAKRYKITDKLIHACKSSFTYGGCLMYIDCGLDDLTQPLNMEKDCKNFKGFRIIDPVMCVGVDVNTVEVGKDDYMEPKFWSITGLGSVHKSHLIKFEYNNPPLFLKPLTLYFGMPLTQLIKQDIANANLVSQGLSNLVNKVRRTFIKMDLSQFAKGNISALQNRLKTMQKVENNFTIFPIDLQEEVMQLTTSLSGFQEIIDTFYNLVSSKTGITVNKLMGKATGGLNAGSAQAESDKNFIDKIETIQQSLIKDNILKMYQVIACSLNEKELEFEYRFYPLFNQSEKEVAETQSLNVDIAMKLEALGVDNKECIEWLQLNESNKMEGITAPNPDEYDDAFGSDKEVLTD